jgi:hypothetical protein
VSYSSTENVQSASELQHPIADWRPDLVTEVTITALECNRRLAKHADDEAAVADLKRRSAELMETLVRLDPALAYRQSKA